MKLKSDFVTNSSSTSYIVCIPEELDESYFESVISNSKHGYEDEIEELSEQVVENFDVLRDGGDVWGEEYPAAFDVTIEICQEFGFVLKEISGGPDEGSLLGLSREKLHDQLHYLGDEWKERK